MEGSVLMKRIILVLLILSLFVSIAGCGIRDLTDQVANIFNTEDPHVLAVKNGSPFSYPEKTYGEAFETFFAFPTWKYFVGTVFGPDDDGDGEPDYTKENLDIVEFTGYCLYLDVEVKALVQFTLDEGEGVFEATYLSFNDVPQSLLMLAALVEAAFEADIQDRQGESVFDGIADTFGDESSNRDLTESKPTASPNVSETESETVKLLNRMQYTGNSNACSMSAEQASAFAAILKNAHYPVVKAALFDGGNGIPLLWVAHGESENSADAYMDFVLDEDYGDQIYAFNNGSVVECPWMTTVLRTGQNGVIVQSWTPRESEFGVSFRMYHMTNGLISDTPFATGSCDPFQGAYLNDRQVGWGGNVDVWDLYNMAESDLATLLEASSWSSGQLNLTGNWTDGQTMCSLLESYARALNGGGSTSAVQPANANAAYRAILDELYTRYGGPVEHRNGEMGEEPSYTGVCGGYLADIGGGDGPELIVAFANEGEYWPQSFIRIYTWNGSTAVLVEEYQVQASINGRAWNTYGLYKDENGYAFFITEEYLSSYDDSTGTFYPGGAATTYYSLNGLQMQGCNPYYDAKEVSETIIGTYDYIRIHNYSELYNRLT